MKIYVDASRAIRANPTGIEIYCKAIIQNLLALPEATQHQWVLLHPRTEKEPDAFGELPPHAQWEAIAGKRFWTLASLSKYFSLRQNEEACLFVPGHVLPYFTPSRSVVTVHDLAFRYFPQLYGFTGSITIDKEVSRSARKASRIIVPSLSAKHDLKKFYNIHESKISVIPHAVDHEVYKMYQKNTKKPYFVFIGRLEARKNIERIVLSFLAFAKTDPQAYNLYLIGRPSDYWKKFWDETVKVPHAERIHVLGYISDREKIKLLAEATALFFPSIYEGFGIPVLEAMALGTPIVTSNVSSLPEIAQDAALYVNPEDIPEMTTALQTLASNPMLVKRLSDRGKRIAEEFTWERTARLTLAALNTPPTKGL